MEQYPQTGRLEERGRIVRYAVVYEPTGNGYSAYVPDLPGCVATGRTRKQVEANIRKAIEFHLDGIRADRERVPEPQVWTGFVEA